MRRAIVCCFVLTLCLASASGQGRQYPKPQIASAAGKPAPDFSLNDQDGTKFTLSQEHGHWVLLFFYRGYW
jgi:cytochrome oxidase Cu insertion factor (SCO1/SenC/PrrC family)